MSKHEHLTVQTVDRLQIEFDKKFSNVERRWRLTRTRLGQLSSVLAILLVAWLMWFAILGLNGDSMSVSEHSSMFLSCLLTSMVLYPLVYLYMIQPRRFVGHAANAEKPVKRLYVLNAGEATLDVMHDEERRSFPLTSLRHYKSFRGKIFRFEDRFLYIPSSPQNDTFSSKLVEYIDTIKTAPTVAAPSAF